VREYYYRGKTGGADSRTRMENKEELFQKMKRFKMPHPCRELD
jgi:hypothetical protein